MFKKTQQLALTALALSMATAHAGTYAGLGLGSDSVDYKQNSHVFQLANFNVINKVHLSSTGVFGTIFAGYEHFYGERFYLAAEVNGNLSGTEFKTSNVEILRGGASRTYYKMQNSLGVSLLPGYQLAPNSLMYGRLGYENTRFKSDTTDISLGNVSQRKNGFRYGLGLKQALNDRWAVRLDYSRVSYNNTRFSTLDILSSTGKDTVITPTQQLVELGIIWRFQ